MRRNSLDNPLSNEPIQQRARQNGHSGNSAQFKSKPKYQDKQAVADVGHKSD